MKCVQISIIARVSGNVNADEVIGNRITIKKMYDSEGNVYPFVSARAIKYSIRQKLAEKGFSIDPLISMRRGEREVQWIDSGKPWEYVDNDLFGYMVPERERVGGGRRRTAPVAISYFKALRHTNVSTEFGARFPRVEDNPNPFEIEVADIIGRLNVIIYEYIGRESKYDNEKWEIKITEDERKRRIRALLEILLIERFVLPRRTNSLSIPEYYYALITLSPTPLPIYQYLDYKIVKDGIPVIDEDKLKTLYKLINKIPNKPEKIYLIDYLNSLQYNEVPDTNIKIIKVEKLNEIIEEIKNWL